MLTIICHVYHAIQLTATTALIRSVKNVKQVYGHLEGLVLHVLNQLVLYTAIKLMELLQFPVKLVTYLLRQAVLKDANLDFNDRLKLL